MFKELTCEGCGKTFTGWETRRLCDECKRERELKTSREYATEKRKRKKAKK